MFFAGYPRRSILLKEVRRNTSSMVHHGSTVALPTMVSGRNDRFHCIMCNKIKFAAALKLRMDARRLQVSVPPENSAAAAIVPSNPAKAATAAVAPLTTASGLFVHLSSYCATPSSLPWQLLKHEPCLHCCLVYRVTFPGQLMREFLPTRACYPPFSFSFPKLLLCSVGVTPFASSRSRRSRVTQT